ncbi:serine/threonine-protein kinase [Botrimarina sp.]|uniref:serine/threonine-protein kinase n=1 Tax=Botrimarina sp. TaxID=2795802 RepID=UPI0032EF1681
MTRPTDRPASAPSRGAGATNAAPTPLVATLVASRLIDPLAVHRVAAHVESQRPTSVEDFERRLADRLVETKLLNRWQVDQLKRGRTKFTLGPYRILDSIARGGMGHVFKCEHELLGRVEAVKVLPLRKSTPETIAGFRNEIRSQAALDHPNLVRVSFADRDGGAYYLVTEYVPGIDLRRLVRRDGPLDEAVAAWVVSQAAEAIDHAHRRGFVHRDVKPGNILLTPSGAVKVTDLGLAWSLQAAWSLERNDGPMPPELAGKVAGTADYLAPEAITSPDRVRPESDLYSLGCTLYYAVTGKVPFPGGANVEKLRRRLREEPRDASELRRGLSDELLAIIRQMMARRPEDRPASAREVIQRLEPIVAEDSRRQLAAVVTTAVAGRVAAEDSASTWGSGDPGDLPETVGLPLHDIDPNAPDASRHGDAPASATDPQRSPGGPSARSLGRVSSSAPMVVTIVALAVAVGVLLFAVLQRVG